MFETSFILHYSTIAVVLFIGGCIGYTVYMVGRCAKTLREIKDQLKNKGGK